MILFYKIYYYILLDCMWSIAVIAFSIACEVVFYWIGLIPAKFYSNLHDQSELIKIAIQLLLLSFSLSLLILFKSLVSSRLQLLIYYQLVHENCTKYFKNLSEFNQVCDVEQRLMDDSRDLSQVMVQFFTKFPLPFMVIWYTFACFSNVMYAYTIPIVYTFALIAGIFVRFLAEFLKKELMNVDKCFGEGKAMLCWARINKDFLEMTKGSSWHLFKYMDFTKRLLLAMWRYSLLSGLLEGFQALTSYYGAGLNYVIIILFMQSSQKASLSIGDASKHSFLILMLISKLDDSIKCIDLIARYQAFQERTRIFHFKQPCDMPTSQGILLESVTVNIPITLPWNLSLNTQNHRIIYIVGSNGSGKTALIRRITGIWKGSGLVRIPKDYFIIPQGPFMISEYKDVYELFQYPTTNHFHMENITECLKLVRLAALPKSPGEWQRFHLARLLLHRPSVALLDEPISQMSCTDGCDLLKKIFKLLPQTHFIILFPDVPEIIKDECNHVIYLD